MDPNIDERNKLFFQAAMAIDARRDDDVINILQTLVETVGILYQHEMELFWIIFKRKTCLQRNAILVVSNALKWESLKNVQLIIDYHQSLKKELVETCTKALSLLDLMSIPNCETMEATAGYFRMRGDYYRYQAEVVTDQVLDDVIEKAIFSYKRAYEISLCQLSPRNVIRLSIALNFAVLYNDILEKPKEAIEMAEEAIKNAGDTPCCDCEDSKVAEVISFLHDNLEVWKKDVEMGTGTGTGTDTDSEDSN